MHLTWALPMVAITGGASRESLRSIGMRYLDLRNKDAKIFAKITMSGGLVDKYKENHATIVVVMQFSYKKGNMTSAREALRTIF